MFNLGPLELVAIFVVALLVFGPDKLPEMGRQVGKAVREFRKFQASMQGQVREVLDPITGPIVPNGDVGPPATNVRGGPLPTGANVPRSATIQNPESDDGDEAEPAGTYGHYDLDRAMPGGDAGNGAGEAAAAGGGAAPAGGEAPTAGEAPTGEASPPDPESR